MFSQLKRTAIRAVSLTAIFTLLGTTVALAASAAWTGVSAGMGSRRQTSAVAGRTCLMPRRCSRTQDRWRSASASIRYMRYATISRNFSLARYEADGDLDSTFSGDGMRVTDFGGLDAAYDIAIQDDGKIVVSGKKSTPTWFVALQWPATIPMAAWMALQHGREAGRRSCAGNNEKPWRPGDPAGWKDRRRRVRVHGIAL